MFITSSIPDKITYIISNQKQLYRGYNYHLSLILTPEQKKQMITPALAADAADKNMVNKCIRNSGTFNLPKVNTITMDNIPTSNVRLVSFDTKFSGVSSYKVIVNNLYVDLQEEVLLESILNEGVEAGGLLKGEFIWAKIANRLKLIKVGSNIYNNIINFQKKKNIKPISKNLLEVGGVYENCKKEKYIFLGHANTTSFSPSLSVSKFHFHKKPVKGFVLLRLADTDSLPDLTNLNYFEENIHSFCFRNSHKLIEKVDQINLSNDILDKVRQGAIKKIKNQLVKFVNKTKENSALSPINENYLSYIITQFSKLLNVHSSQSKAIEPFNINKYLIFT